MQLKHPYVIFILVVTFAQYIFGVSLKDYCQYSPRNFVCETKCKPPPSCPKQKYPFVPLDKTEQVDIIKRVFEIRARVATGRYGYGVPTASNMNMINLDKECMFLAECYVKSCSKSSDLIILAANGDPIGILEYALISINETDNKIGISQIVTIIENWLNRVKQNDKINLAQVIETPINYRDIDRPELHSFLALVYAQTKFIGCARYYHQLQSSLYYYSFVCMLRPGGFLLDNYVYKIGIPGSVCTTKENGSSDLCGSHRHSMEDHFILPDLSKGFSKKSMGTLIVTTFLLHNFIINFSS